MTEQTTRPPSLWGRSAAIAGAVLFNLAPIIGVLFWGWSAFALIFIYWLENVVVGVRTALSMLASGAQAGAVGVAGTLAIVGFFCVHYGLFCLVHGFFVIAMFSDGLEIASPWNVPEVIRTVFAASPNLALGFASICAWQVVQLALFLARGEARRTNPLALMGAPYPRMIVLHIAIIFGGGLVMMFGEPVWGLTLLALLKMAFDIHGARNEGKPDAGGGEPERWRKVLER